MARIPYICADCHRIVPARTRHACRSRDRAPDTRTNADRLKTMPWRAAYSDPEYKRNRLKRYEIAAGKCESCGVGLKGKRYKHGVPWQCDHVIEARRFTDPRQANCIANLRATCVRCHKAKTAHSR